MFKFSLEWLRDYCGKDIKFEEILKKLRLQGFEFQGSEKIGDDTVTAIEVKANRPDMLSHIGIAREIKAFDGEPIPQIKKSGKIANNKNFAVGIDVDKKICKRFCAMKLSGVNSFVETPLYIKRRLAALGINSVNVVVDIGNYVMLDVGQPMHCYDFDKIDGNKMYVGLAKVPQEAITFSGEIAKVNPEDIIISDGSGVKCIAGIVGTDSAAVTVQTKNIVLEAAVFDEVSIRLSSRRLKISTPSSFRFERGVNAQSSLDALTIYADMITKICGGKIEQEVFDFYPQGDKDKFLKLNVQKNNSLLGLEFKKDQVIKYLEKYDFKCESQNSDVIKVKIPPYRLDVKQEVDLIEEVARIHGYDNIAPVMPTITTSYNKNEIWFKANALRKFLTGLGFNETINYSFIPNNTMSVWGIEKGEDLYSDLVIQNPIAGAYSLMRPMLAYSLLNCLAFNYSVGNTNLGLFELGRVYFKNSSFDTNCCEIDTCAFIMSGVRVPKGFGNDKDIKYTYYDLLSYLKILFNEFGQEFELEKNNFKFCEEGSGYSIITRGERIGFIGELNKSRLIKVPNVKLIKDKIFYCEFYIKDILEKIKKVEFESKYPCIKRLYNLIQSKSLLASQVIDLIKSSSELIRSVTVKDIYSDKMFDPETHAVLYEINYCSKVSTLTSQEIENIENDFLRSLDENFGISLKK